MEWNIYRTCIDPAIGWLEMLRQYRDRYYEYDQFLQSILVMTQKLRLVKMFFWGLAYWEDLEYDWHMHFPIHTMMSKFGRSAQEFAADFERVHGQKQGIDWEAMIYDLEKNIEEFKPQTRDICTLLLGGSYQCTSCPSNQKKFLEYKKDTASFIELIRQNLVTLQNSGPMTPVLKLKQHIAMIQQGLEEFQMFVDPPNVLFELVSRTRAWFNRISCLTYLCWIEGSDGSLASSMETMIYSLIQETMPCSSLVGTVSYYFRCSKIHQPLAGYLDLLLQDLVIPMKDDVYEGVIFLLSFVMDPPVELDSEDSKMIWAQSLAAMKKFPSLISSVSSGEMKVGVCAVDLSDFVMKVDVVKEKVRKYLVAPYSSEFSSPSTNFIGFLNSIIGNLKEMLQEEVNCIPSLKHQGKFLLKELVLLMPVVSNITELLVYEDDEIQDLWTEITSTVYNMDYFIKLCHCGGFYVWCGILGLPSLRQAIMSVKNKINKMVGVDKMYNKKSSGHHDHVEGADDVQPRGTTSEINAVYMDFIKEKSVIIDELTGGPNSLTIISISGSGGQGKTTLAKQIYNDPKVQYHFHKSGWCYISKDCTIKRILVQVINDVNKDDDRMFDVSKYEVHDLADHLRKCLKGRRYFIVMDDIWEVDIWRELKWSFPDDNKGSRILFTSRNHDLASQVKSRSISHPLPLFSDVESWELMKKRVFGSDYCDKKFVGIGKKIAGYCKGLPLAVHLAAGVLGRTHRNLDSWNKVAENLKGHLAQEGCGNVLELSYRYLPDYLKSCFLYFGAFQRGVEVKAEELKLLWVGEGFIIPDGEGKSTEKDLATEYLKDLVSQSLVVVTRRSSMGEIKRCSVHDLLYDLCLAKCEEENFLHCAEVKGAPGTYSTSTVHKNGHRLRVSDPFIKSSPSVMKRPLPINPLHSLFWMNTSRSCGKSLFRCLGSFKILTVLKLEYELDEFPEVMLSLIYLRYLKFALHFCGFIQAIPRGIANLRKLRILLVSCDGILLPVTMWNMKSLRNVNIKGACPNLEEFVLKKSSGLFEGVSNIEALGFLHLDVDDSRTTEFLQNFPNLRKLKCISKSTAHVTKLLSMVGSLLPQLESLRVYCAFYRGPNPVIWNIPKIENLKKLTLYRTLMPWSVVSEIGKQLPNLRVLNLLYASCLGDSWKFEEGDFSKLIYLKLHNLDIKDIDVSSCDDGQPFPSLEHLVLVACFELKEIPSIFGESYSLKSIKIILCNERVKNSAMSILEQQRDYGNESFQVRSTEY